MPSPATSKRLCASLKAADGADHPVQRVTLPGPALLRIQVHAAQALLRPGRFDRQVTVDLPERHGREAILKIHARGVPLAPDANLEDMARVTPGFSGADLENLVNEAALAAARRASTQV